MKKNQLTMWLFGAVLMAFAGYNSACKPDRDIKPAPVEGIAPRLKEIVATNLPSPYYHFIYDAAGKVSSISYASGLLQYDLEYKGDRLIKMDDAVTGDMLSYSYTGNQVAAIDIYSGDSGERQWHCDFQYNQQKQLTRVRWYFIRGAQADSLLERVLEYEYRADGNISGHKTWLADDDGAMVLSSTVTFENYDSNVNVDDFQIGRQFFDHFLYLPGIKVQKNNPVMSRMMGVQNEYEFTYQYTYQNRVPQVKTTTMRKVRGENSGAVSTSSASYSYY